ncbi:MULTISPECIES: hypothetical protein [unclassified Aureimonas]|uniref:hypothetical protein n=1 Tax=unclassified Aureimonas TaxID=2615206 RepID=UPI000B209C10|nr:MULTISPECIES: hypothetical protein [unclassified Aureimonas]
MTEDDARGAFDTYEPFASSNDMDGDSDASPAEKSGEREAESLAERLRALEAFSAA